MLRTKQQVFVTQRCNVASLVTCSAMNVMRSTHNNNVYLTFACSYAVHVQKTHQHKDRPSFCGEEIAFFVAAKMFPSSSHIVLVVIIAVFGVFGADKSNDAVFTFPEYDYKETPKNVSGYYRFFRKGGAVAQYCRVR